MALLSTVFTTEAEIERRFGSQATEWWTDHSETAYDVVTDNLNDAINQATQELILTVGQRYSIASMNSYDLIRRYATTIAAYILCTTRGNSPPVSLENEYFRLMGTGNQRGLLDKIGTGAVSIPDLAMRGDLRPTMSNRRIDRRYNEKVVRIDKQTSTDSPTTLKRDTLSDYPGDI